ncbi:diguanylate cyclase domain-containing protein [Deinococcus navajonensis]|uniref:Diguanylate cyclase domain-containing protein n=1 Tax=Deinococcus navajonensis TaxID=309884 RepID=A0ABV8XMU5_9DEIO
MAPHDLRVLIVDDDEDDFVLTEDLLRRIQGWTCRVAWVNTVEAAADEIRSQAHDVYLIDYRLGAQSGLDVLERLKESGCTAPAILLTGVDNREVDLAAMRHGASDYLVKSDLSTVVLERSLRYALERSRLLCEVEQARQEAETLFTLSSALEQSSSANEVMRNASALLNNAVGVDVSLLWEIREGQAFLLYAHGDLPDEFLQQGRAGLQRTPAPIWEALDQRTALYVDDVAGHPQILPLFRQVHIRCLAHLPLDVNGKVYILSYLSRTREQWRAPERRLLEAGGRSIGVALERRQSLELLAAAALTDGLTGLGNRRAFDEALDAALNSAARHGYPVSVVSFDLDGLKAINDREGHARGDEFLRTFAQRMRAGLRREDLFFRFGGDEFAAILSHTSPAGFQAVLGRVRRAVEGLRTAGFPHADVSAGVASYPAEAGSAGDLLRLSDDRMYQQKLQHRAQKG